MLNEQDEDKQRVMAYECSLYNTDYTLLKGALQLVKGLGEGSARDN